LKLVLLVLFAALLFAAPSQALVHPDCVTGGLTSTGTLTISWSGDTPSAVASGWGACGETLTYSYAWSQGGSGVTGPAVAAGTNVTVTMTLSDVDFGTVGTWNASSTAPGGGGGGGGGGGSGVPVLTMAVTTPNPQPAGDTAQITYNAPGATSCYLNVQGGYQGAVPAPSYTNYSIGSIGATSLIQENCTNASGTSNTVSVTITVTTSGPDCAVVPCPPDGYQTPESGTAVQGSGNGQYGGGTFGECDTYPPFGVPPVSATVSRGLSTTIKTVKLLIDCYGPIKPTTIFFQTCFVRNGSVQSGTCVPVYFTPNPLQIPMTYYVYPITHSCLTSTLTSWAYLETMTVTWANGAQTTTQKQSSNVALQCG
jgi:hypothetical protein